MAGYKIPSCTDEEILNELKELGYEDVSPEIFWMMKKDISLLISRENCGYLNTPNRAYNSIDWKNKKLSQPFNSDDTPRIKNPLQDLNSNICPALNDVRKRIVKKLDTSDSLKTKYFQASSNKPNIRKFSSLQHRYSDSELYGSFLQNNPTENNETSEIASFVNRRSVSSLSSSGNSIYGENKSFQSGKESESNSIVSNEKKFMPVRQLSVVKEVEINPDENMYLNTAAEVVKSSEIMTPITNKNLSKDLKLRNKTRLEKNSSLQSQNLNSSSDLELSFSSLSINGKLKRKTLKNKAGIQFITEEFINTPSVFSSSYPNSSKSFSNSDLSFKSNSSTGSLVALSPDYSLSPRSDSTKTRPFKPPRKKHDPVAMYNYYKKYWDNFKPPGEKTHDKLRWAVRDKMLDYSL